VIGGGEDADLARDDRDSAAFMPKARIVPAMPMAGTRAPRNPWPRTIIYEAHVRGLTMRHPLVPDDMRGTFAALAVPEV
ncbi:glycogen debranching enzyme, partial [Klebsiella pneumoniae]